MQLGRRRKALQQVIHRHPHPRGEVLAVWVMQDNFTPAGVVLAKEQGLESSGAEMRERVVEAGLRNADTG